MVAQNNPARDTIRSMDKMTDTNADEETNDEILADLRQAIQEALASDLRPALEVLDEIDSEITDQADYASGPAATEGS